MKRCSYCAHLHFFHVNACFTPVCISVFYVVFAFVFVSLSVLPDIIRFFHVNACFTPVCISVFYVVFAFVFVSLSVLPDIIRVILCARYGRNCLKYNGITMMLLVGN